MSYSIEDAKSRYQICKRLTFSMMCRSRKLPYSPGRWEFKLYWFVPFPTPSGNFSLAVHFKFWLSTPPSPPPPTPQKFPVFLHGVGMCISLKYTNKEIYFLLLFWYLGSGNLNVLKSTKGSGVTKFFFFPPPRPSEGGFVCP